MTFGKGGTLEAQHVLLAERMGWTLDYVRSLSVDDYFTVLGVLDGYDSGIMQRRKAGN